MCPWLFHSGLTSSTCIPCRTRIYQCVSHLRSTRSCMRRFTRRWPDSDLSQRSLFNDFLIGVAAGLAAETVQLLVAVEHIDLDPGVRRAAVADLLTWDDDHFHCLVDALEQVGLDLGASAHPRPPARTEVRGHHSIRSAYGDRRGLRSSPPKPLSVMHSCWISHSVTYGYRV